MALNDEQKNSIPGPVFMTRFNDGRWVDFIGEINNQSINDLLLKNNAQIGDVIEIQHINGDKFTETGPILDSVTLKEFDRLILTVNGKIIETKYMFDNKYL